MDTAIEYIPPALARAESMVAAMERHVSFITDSLRRAPVTKQARLERDLGKAQVELAARRVVLEDIRSMRRWRAKVASSWPCSNRSSWA